MKPLLLFAAYAYFLLLIITLPSCKKDSADNTSISRMVSADQRVAVPDDENKSEYNTFYGPAMQLGNGHMRSWVNIDHSGKPLAMLELR